MLYGAEYAAANASLAAHVPGGTAAAIAAIALAVWLPVQLFVLYLQRQGLVYAGTSEELMAAIAAGASQHQL